MSFQKSRVDAIRALLAGSQSVSKSSNFTAIVTEWDEVKSLSSIALLRRRHLLAVLHSTRALDDTLKAFVKYHKLSSTPSKSLGNSLKFLQDAPPGTLTSAFTMRSHFQNTIANVRNRYMHEAGAYPNSDYEVRTLIAEMEHCVTVVLACE